MPIYGLHTNTMRYANEMKSNIRFKILEIGRVEGKRCGYFSINAKRLRWAWKEYFRNRAAHLWVNCCCCCCWKVIWSILNQLHAFPLNHNYIKFNYIHHQFKFMWAPEKKWKQYQLSWWIELFVWSVRTRTQSQLTLNSQLISKLVSVWKYSIDSINY